VCFAQWGLRLQQADHRRCGRLPPKVAVLCLSRHLDRLSKARQRPILVETQARKRKSILCCSVGKTGSRNAEVHQRLHVCGVPRVIADDELIKTRRKK